MPPTERFIREKLCIYSDCRDEFLPRRVISQLTQISQVTQLTQVGQFTQIGQLTQGARQATTAC